MNSAHAQTGNCGEFDGAWHVCALDADCTLSKSACGWPTAYSVAHLAAAQAYNACMAPTINCAEPLSLSAYDGAMCVEGKCTPRPVADKASAPEVVPIQDSIGQ